MLKTKPPAARPSLEAELDRQLEKFDGLMHDVRLGVRDQNHFDALEERTQAIAEGMVKAFRGRRG